MNRRGAVAFALVLLVLAGACSRQRRPDVRPGARERGEASWYGPGFQGNHTANGEIYDMHGISAAHKTLPFGTLVEVRNLDNGRTVVVRINDRGPFVRGRIIDLSRGAAEKIGLVRSGVAPVELTILESPGTSPASREDDGAWFVQAGAFRDADHAHTLRAELSAYPDARVVTDDGWHRVRIGPFRNKDRAREAVRELRAAGVEAFRVRL